MYKYKVYENIIKVSSGMCGCQVTVIMIHLIYNAFFIESKSSVTMIQWES